MNTSNTLQSRVHAVGSLALQRYVTMQRELSGGCIGEVLVVPKHIMGPGSENWSAQPAGQVLQTAPVPRESLLC